VAATHLFHIALWNRVDHV